MLEQFEKDIPLSGLTTIRLGGNAKYLYRAKSVEGIAESVKYARSEGLRLMMIGGGSNLVFGDSGFDGLIIKNELKGIEVIDGSDELIFECASGEIWDDIVKLSVDARCTGIECMSGIPGTVGATPIQNVGAYGQEVSDCIYGVLALDMESFKQVRFANSECGFRYRSSCFKRELKGQYCILSVAFRLSPVKSPLLKYDALNSEIRSKCPDFDSLSTEDKIKIIRSTVLEIRKKKSMLILPDDPDSRSCGSFFTNPVIASNEFGLLKEYYESLKMAPAFADGDNVKISAAWLIENSGFKKGYTRNGAGISASHSLALVNRGGNSGMLIELANEISETVEKKFGIRLETEPEIVQ